MKTTKTIALASFILAVGAIQTATAGRIIGLSDDWMIGGDFNAPGCTASNFVANSFAFLTAPSGNRNILIDSQFGAPGAQNITPLLNFLSGSGYSVTLS